MAQGTHLSAIMSDTELGMARANHYQTRNTGRHYVKYMTAYFVRQHLSFAQNALKLFTDE